MIKNLRDKAKNKKGFTLVELIVVIVIILILAAVLVPNLLKYVDKSRQANCKSDAASILTQVQADYADAQTTDVATAFPGTGYEVSGKAYTEEAAPGANQFTFTIVVPENEKESVITKFVYNNGKYTATWDSATTDNNGWTITKN